MANINAVIEDVEKLNLLDIQIYSDIIFYAIMATNLTH